VVGILAGLDKRIKTINTPTIFFKLKNNTLMGYLLYVLAVILVIAWAIGFIGYGAGGIIHILLVIAVIAILLNIIGGRRAV
jgi:predicted ferric reductase